MENIEELQQGVLNDWDIDPQFLPATNNDEERFAALRTILMRRIEELAEKDMEKLLFILYRIDVSEKKLYAVMRETLPDAFSATIADLIIERQLQKIKTRQQFGGKENDWNFDV